VCIDVFNQSIEFRNVITKYGGTHRKMNHPHQTHKLDVKIFQHFTPKYMEEFTGK
jgi:hypothetical protein